MKRMVHARALFANLALAVGGTACKNNAGGTGHLVYYEWCWDWYGGYSTEDANDPQGADSGSGRVGFRLVRSSS